MKIEITHSERVNNDFTDTDKYTPPVTFEGWVAAERWIADKAATGGFWITQGTASTLTPKIWIPWHRVVRVEIVG